jgi:hypothetical protein
VNLLVVHQDKRYIGGFTNMIRGSKGTTHIGAEFHYGLQELADFGVFVNGSGGNASGWQHAQRIRRQTGIAPNRPFDYMRLVAQVNRTIAETNRTVSPHCHVSFQTGPGFKFSPQSHAFVQTGESVPYEMPRVLMGIDLGEMTSRFVENIQRQRAGLDLLPDLPLDQVEVQLRRRP